MGAYSYCQNDNCQAGFGPPTTREVIEKKRTCDACGKTSPVYDSIVFLFDALEERIEALEAEVALLKGEKPALQLKDLL